MTNQKIITLVYDEIKRPTDLACLFVFGDKEAWLPRSQIDIDGKTKTVEVPLWLVEEKELEDYEY